ncbi:MAG: LysM peptidoglycan-binding domain-containing protein [Anaerolineales bacterium]|nr:LysM peptidoglycan-binding domain-containing protein [Anaerolineales bacterium]
MKLYRILFVFLVIILTLSLAACERSASPPPVGADETDVEYPVVDENATLAPKEQLVNISTQTAMAAEGGAMPAAEVAEMENAASAEDAVPAEEVKPTATQEPEAAPAAQPQPEPEEEKEVKTNYEVPNSYTLQPGEFPYCLARRFDVAPAALLSANGLSTSSVTYPGMVLTIPTNSGAFNQGARALRQHPTSYTVSAGDTLNSIACLFGDVDPRAIASKNGMSGAYTLNVGQVLQIP